MTNNIIHLPPLARYLESGKITADQWWSGDLLGHEFDAAGFDNGVPLASSALSAIGPGAISDAELIARRNYLAAMRVVPKPCADVVTRVCCERRDMVRNGDLAMLRVGLDMLADHYRRLVWPVARNSNVA